MIAAVVLAWRRSFQTDQAAAFVYFWLFFVPVADIGFALSVWTLGGDNDIAKALGQPTTISAAGVVAFGLLISVLGYVVQARLYDRLKLSWAPYSALVMTSLLLIGGLFAAGYRLSTMSS